MKMNNANNRDLIAGVYNHPIACKHCGRVLCYAKEEIVPGIQWKCQRCGGANRTDD